MIAQNDPPPLPQKPRKAKAGTSPLVKYYLIFYNIISALGWSYVLLLTLVHLFNLDSQSPVISGSQSSTSPLTPILSTLRRLGYARPQNFEARLPLFLQPLYRRATTTYTRVGTQTAFVQTAAILEVLHVLLGLVRSSLLTTAMQVSSRLVLVWAITERFDVARTSPTYASMVIAWSTTEVVRYCYYVCMLVGLEPRPLVWLRYTLFYALYPIGAGSEASLIFVTLPRSSPVSSAKGTWKLADYGRALLFFIWWPSLYVLFMHMVQMRRKVFGGGQTLGAKPRSKVL